MTEKSITSIDSAKRPAPKRLLSSHAAVSVPGTHNNRVVLDVLHGASQRFSSGRIRAGRCSDRILVRFTDMLPSAGANDVKVPARHQSCRHSGEHLPGSNRHHLAAAELSGMTSRRAGAGADESSNDPRNSSRSSEHSGVAIATGAKRLSKPNHKGLTNHSIGRNNWMRPAYCAHIRALSSSRGWR